MNRTQHRGFVGVCHKIQPRYALLASSCIGNELGRGVAFFWCVKTAFVFTLNLQKRSISSDIPNRFRRFYSDLKATNEGFQTTVKSSKTVRYIIRYGPFYLYRGARNSVHGHYRRPPARKKRPYCTTYLFVVANCNQRIPRSAYKVWSVVP